MKTITILLFAFALSCSTEKNIDRQCEANFEVFFQKFAADSVFQKKHVAFPVIGYYSNDDPKGRKIGKAEYVFTDFRHDEELYDISIDKKKDTIHYVRTWRNSYGAMTYTFANKNNCWMLVEIHDITD